MTTRLLTAATATLLMWAGCAIAASTNTDQAAADTLSKASSWIGANVEDLSGNSVGQVKDLAIDWQAGRVAYAVVAIDHWQHIDSKVVAIPPDRLAVDRGGKRVVVQMTEAEVSALPAIETHPAAKVE